MVVITGLTVSLEKLLHCDRQRRNILFWRKGRSTYVAEDTRVGPAVIWFTNEWMQYWVCAFVLDLTDVFPQVVYEVYRALVDESYATWGGGGSTLGFCYMRTLVGEAMVGNTVPQPLRMKCLSSFTTACLANNSDKCSLDALTENAAKVLDRYNHPSLYQLDHPTSCPAECSHQDSIQIRYTCI